ncbi:hypothetical protein POTOM_041811 [Populus tomentosa]|uniref:Potassium transporter n=1 Tax=Populus tomentosa TaxID=118781 RepID=A0A8X7YRB1_POPTO|nr:hypothetical protein POTOM_041811 [Populus tomentosa]
MDHPPSPTTSSDRLKETWRHALVLSFQTLGVVYGRLSTAPLYVFGTIQTKDFKSNEIAYEYFSFIFWTLTVVSLLKYAFIVLRADDNGEGSETMFTDLGHFSKRSIKITFVCLIYPVLILCYAGQAAFISKYWNGPEKFNHLSESIPEHLRHVFILLSLLASAVGSQATITASFSIINQCRALSCFPRVKVIHTSDKRHGQVYIPDVNWLLMALSLSITLGFHDVTRIANAAAFFSHFITNLPAFHQVLIFVSFKPQPVPCVPPSQRCCVGRVGGKDYRIYRCIVRYGYCDQVRDTDDFEEQIIGSIGEYISLDESDCESLTSPEGRTVIVGTPLLEGHALIPVDDTNLVSGSTNAANNETMAIPVGDLIGRNAHVRRKKVRFLIPESSPRLRVSLSGMSYKN